MLEVTHMIVLNAIHHSCYLEGTKRPLIWLLLLFNKHRKDHLQIQTHSEMHEVSDISRFTICGETCPTRRRVAYFMWQKIKTILLFSVIILACFVYSISYMFLIPLQNLCPVCHTYTWIHVCITFYYVHATILEFILLFPLTLEILHQSIIDLYALLK